MSEVMTDQSKADPVREALKECLGQLENACSPYAYGSGGDGDWKQERKEIIRNAYDALALPQPATVDRAAVIEECAKVAETLSGDPHWSPGYKSSASVIAGKIRNLATKTGKQP